MLTDTHIVDFILVNNVIQTTKHDKFLNHSYGKSFFMTVPYAKESF